MPNIAIFASGNGSNAEVLVNHFQRLPSVEVVCILTNKPGAYVLTRAERLGVPAKVFDKASLENGTVTKWLIDQQVDFIILAGFLLKIPDAMIQAFPNRIINIHPSILPKYGGKGMYGHHVHEAVIEAGEKESGITIHLVNEAYDQGRILFQKSIPVVSGDTPESLALRIHDLEHRHFPEEVEKYILSEAKD